MKPLGLDRGSAPGTLCHDLPSTAFRIVSSCTPYIRPNGVYPIVPVAYSARISMTWRADRRVECCRPLDPMSRALTNRGPMNRWAGFTHGGLSQRWHTSSPVTSSLKCSNHAARLAFRYLPRRKNFPYPPFATAPVHSQQPLFGSNVTCRMNRSNSRVGSPMSSIIARGSDWSEAA